MKKKHGKNGRSAPFEPYLLEKLKDVDFAADFLNASYDGDTDEEFEAFFNAVALISKAYGITQLSEKASITRDALYKLFQSRNPKFKTLRSVLNALELDIAIVPKKRA
jgi:probable addiction module antidote protein